MWHTYNTKVDISLIRHGKTDAMGLYCGFTDIPLSDEGRRDIITRTYPAADLYVHSGLERARETINLIYDTPKSIVVEELKEMNFGLFEMMSYEELRHNSDYIYWIGDVYNIPCPGGESTAQFEDRVCSGFRKVIDLCSANNYMNVSIVSHGGVISTIMGKLFPNQANFYEWQPDYGRGYTLILEASGKASYLNI